jgi:hypothetical protein
MSSPSRTRTLTLAHLPAAVPQSLHARLGRGRHQPSLGRRVSARRAGDLGGLSLRKPPGSKRLLGRRQLIQRPSRLEGSRCGSDGRACRRGHPVGGAAISGLAPHPGLVRPTGKTSLHGSAQPFPSRHHLEQARRVAAFEHLGLEIARGLLQQLHRAGRLREHASPSGRTDQDGGSARGEVATSLSNRCSTIKRWGRESSGCSAGARSAGPTSCWSPSRPTPGLCGRGARAEPPPRPPRRPAPSRGSSS